MTILEGGKGSVGVVRVDKGFGWDGRLEIVYRVADYPSS